MAEIHEKYPLKIRLPEDNGGRITSQDMFSGMTYFDNKNDIIENEALSSSLSKNFNIFSTFNAPELIRYIPSLDIFSSTFYKGIYIYNPSIENDGVLYETERRNIVFSVNGGSAITLDEVSTPVSGTIVANEDTIISDSGIYADVAIPSDLASLTEFSIGTYYLVENWFSSPDYPSSSDSGFVPGSSELFRWSGTKWLLSELDTEVKTYYETRNYISDLNNTSSLSKIDKTSSNGNIKISVAGETEKNKELTYFSIDGSELSINPISQKQFFSGNSGVSIPDLLPGDYYGLYLKIETLFDPSSRPVDYSFFNMTYENYCPGPSFSCFNQFAPRDNIPGVSTREPPNTDLYNQSFSIKFRTNLARLNRDIDRFTDVIYDNYPPFFVDYREVD